MSRDWSDFESTEIDSERRDMEMFSTPDNETVKELIANARDLDADDERVIDGTGGLCPTWAVKHSLLFNPDPHNPRVDPDGEHVRFTVSRIVEPYYHDDDGAMYVRVIGKPSGEIVEVVVGMELM